MLDMKFVREHPDVVRENLKKRKSELLGRVDDLLEKDDAWRKLKGQSDALRAERNKVSKEINETKKAGGDASKLLERAKTIPQQLKSLEEDMDAQYAEIKRILMRLPNIMHDSVPYGEDEEGNQELAQFGKKPEFAFEPKNHNDLIEGMVNLERAAKIAGSRFYFLQGDLALLEHALQQYAIDFMNKKGYTFVQPPYMMNRNAYEGVTDLADFEDVIYKVEDEDLHLIATSEHPLTAQFQNEVVKLPIKLAGMSPCFRKETGSHGKEEKGIWRVHQFHKVEQIVICKPEESWEYHEEITKNAIEFFESLGLHFRQVLICTGDLGTVAAKKYDLEAWIPSVQKYKEVVSSSNCTSYQAVRLNIRYNEQGTTAFAHTLNSTCVATSRALVAILEQYQNEDGSINVPKVLQPFLNKAKIGPHL
ncbi:MAG: serine--tRNA ligase [Candidatus Woesearchaeota archaeon]|nr:serine--tRNA ligase [Candidatus Woesearchaeota archaeon]